MPTFQQIQQAVTNCMAMEPCKAPDYVMSPDTSQLGDVLSEMIVFKQKERAIDALKPKQLEAYERWKPVDG